ncbi:hypothetical protein CHELA1G11_10601 [Hyphomicrobiales bacterium]|nr:hypothetical protein CHELA1G11_10601 [Hyphomicrobiales bacterium]CAH1673528.1 hypothetical protein CHELA1G2_13702 [Hyphomicrobiales bacterium]
MKILDSLAALITVARDDKATSTIIAESLDKARAEHSAAATALATAESGYGDALLDSPKAARAAHDALADAVSSSIGQPLWSAAWRSGTAKRSSGKRSKP